jgi:acyl-CoA synthetase (NDP forming)
MRFFTRPQLDRAFNARSIAVIGAKHANNYTWLRRFQSFKGKLYAVHVNPNSIREIEALGIPCYRSIVDVPGPVDYVTCTVPRRLIVDVFTQCIRAKVAAASFFTSGFAECDEEGVLLQRQLAALSRESGVALIGPNGMGLYNPAINMPTSADLPMGEGGPVGIVSQSGTHNTSFIKMLFAWHGIRVGRGVSIGNGAALDAADWIEYIGENDDVKVLAAYIEGIGERGAGDHERFIAAVRRVAAKKPVVIWKGGNSADSARVTAAHTGSAAVSPEDWAWIVRSSGAIGVDSFDALVDTAASLVKLPPPRGPRAGVIILTGGQGITIAEAMSRHGLRVPALSEQSLAELATFFDPIGGGFHNPLDSAYNMENPAVLARQLDLLERDANIDFVVMDLFNRQMPPQRLLGSYGMFGSPGKDAPAGGSFLDAIAAHARKAAKPFFITLTPQDAEREAFEIRELLKQRGVMSFCSVERAAVAYAALLRGSAQRAPLSNPQR